MPKPTKQDGNVMRELVRKNRVLVNKQNDAIREALIKASKNPGDTYNALTTLIAEILETHQRMNEITSEQIDICKGIHRNDRR